MERKNGTKKVSGSKGSDGEISSDMNSQDHDPERMDMILESISDAFFTLDKDLKFIYFNNKAEELLGRKREEVIGKHIFNEAFPEAKWSIFEEKYVQALKQKEGITFETFFGEDPYVNWYDVRVYPAGSGISVFFTVTTERKKMENDLKERESFLNAIFENSLNAIVVADDKGNYIKVNEAASEMFGYSKEELLNMNVSDLITTVGPDAAERYAKYIENGYEIGEFHFLRKDGVKRISLYHAVRIAEDMNLSILSDVTDKKKLEKEMEKRIFDLGERVKELNCLMEIAKIVETKEITIEEILHRSVEIIPPSWQNPEITCARIVYERKEFKTDNFKKTGIKLREPLYIDDDESGWVEVYLLEVPDSNINDPFLKEEKDLLFMIAERLGKVLQRARAENELTKLNQELIASNQQLAAHEQQLKASNQQLEAMNQQLIASEQQLKASNQELSALNQQLTASEQQLKALNQQLLQNEAFLKESNERFDLAMKASRDGLFDWNLVTNEIYYSPGWKSMLGYEDNELPNDFSVWEKLTDPEDVKRSWEMQKELISGKRDRFEMEFQMKHKDGHLVDILSRAEAVFDDKGKAVRIVGTHDDVTDNKKLIEELEKRENETRSMLSSMLNAFVLFDSVFDDEGRFVSYRFVYINEAYEKITGVKNEDVKGKTVHEVWPETEPEWIKRYGEVAVTGRPQSFELYHDPTERDYLCNVYRPYDTKDRFCVIFDDITERKQKERDLKESEERFRSYVESAPYGIFIADDKGKYLDVNPAATEITGYSRDELIGMNLIELIPEEDMEKASNMHKELLSKGESISTEIRFTRKDGAVRYWVVTATPISEGKFLAFTKDITDRKIAEEKLMESERRIRNIIDNSTNMYYAHGTDHILTYVSPQCMEILGYEPEEVMRKWTDLASDHPMNEMAFNNTMKAIETGKRQPTYELQLIRKDGKKIWVEVRESPKVVNGKVTEIIGSLNDITERKRAEDELKKKNQELNALNQQLTASEEQLKKSNTTLARMNVDLKESQRLLNATGTMARIGGWEVNAKTKKVTWSEETYRIHDIPPDHEPQLEEAIDFFHPDDRPILQKALQNAMENGESYDLHLRFISAKGRELITHSKCEPLIEDGKVVKLYGTFQDVTIQKKAEEEILKKQYLLSKSQEIGKIGTWEMDILDNLLVWTDENYRIFGIPIGEPLNYEKFLNCIHPDDRELVDIEWKKGIETGEYDIEHRLLVDGNVRWVREKAEIEFSEDGEPINAVGFTQDITKQKLAEKEIRRAREEVEFYMDLLGHDLGNIHQGVAGSLQLLQEVSGKDDKQSSLLALANESVANARELTKDVILLSKLRHQDKEMIPLDLSEIIDDSIEQISGIFQGKDIEYELDLKETSLKGEQIIKELFFNLLHNALRLQGGKPWIGIRSRRKDGMCRIEISDKGPGVPDPMKNKLFKRFGLKGERIRRGLGLSIVKVLSERYGGKVWVEDRVKGDHEKGAKFIVELPLAK